MIYGRQGSDDKVTATPGGRAACPGCGGSLIAKCGQILIWHWAHELESDCDSWYEPESKWHMKWKRFVHPSKVEVVMGRHRADMVGLEGVVELQHSPLEVWQIVEREEFYGKMIWLIDAREFAKNLSFRPRENYTSFRWKWPRQSWWVAERRMYWHLPDGRIFRVEKIHHEVPCGGWGYFVDFDNFVFTYFGAVKKSALFPPRKLALP